MERAVDKNRSVRIETYAEKQIEITARKLARRYNLPSTETEEIADAFRNAVERRFLATYDETKSSLPTYLSAFLSRQTPNVLRRVFAKKRGYFRRTSLEELLERPGTENASGLFCVFDDDPFRFEEIEFALSQLPDDLKGVCKILMEENVSEAARTLKVTRGKLRRDIERIRKFFEKMQIGAPF